MHIIIRDSNGLREGIVLTASQNRMRVALRGSKDTNQMELRDGQWTLEGRQPAEIESLVLQGDLNGLGSLVSGIEDEHLGKGFKAVA